MTTKPPSFSQRLVSIFVLLGMLLGPMHVAAFSVRTPATSLKPDTQWLFDKFPLYRTQIQLRHTGDQQNIASLVTEVLDMDNDWAVVVVDSDQLQNLARLQMQPRQINSVRQLGFSQSSLAYAAGRTALVQVPSVDSDNDGLTDEEEGWWCTDPNNPNSDGDPQGHSDGTEINALLDLTLPRSTRWGYGPPFGPPAAWPDWNGQDGNPNTPACNDGDFDTIPDFAESFMVGSNPLNETTDYDKFDDGQELFGITYCPGGTTSCGHGNYPRQEYWNFIKATMPNWVLPPGDNLFVSAFPVPEVTVVPDSWTMERVTTITTEEGQMTQATHSYETSVTQGQSTSIADTVTWNNWEEVSKSVETPVHRVSYNTSVSSNNLSRDYASVKIYTGSGTAALGVIAGVGCALITAGGCAVGLALGTLVAGVGASWALSGIDDLYDLRADELPPRKYNNETLQCTIPNDNQCITPSESVNLSQPYNFQNPGISLEGINYSINQQSELLARGLYDISYAIQQPRFTETHTNGRSWGGAQTTTHETYEEHTITEGEAFTTGQNWSTAWAVDSSHAADLTFTYVIENNGTEYAREITGLIFNIYLGDDTNPIISYPAWTQFPNGKLENVFPGDNETFTSDPIPLTLEQMKRIDLGERLTIVMEDFSYGADELFYQDAIAGGITFFIEDGVHDNDELVDSYVIPTWGNETVQDVLTRYFPHGVDSENNLNSLDTPEFNGTNAPVWHEHFLSEIAWWNIYLTQEDLSNTPLHELPAEAGSALLFRFNRDSDRDGYQDRVEWRYETDKNDPVSHPQPEVVAGYTVTRSGDVATVLLKVANLGAFDAYGIDAVMYAPDDTVTIGNNTVGGNGRVRPGHQVAVGSLILPPDLTDWTNSTAQPYAIGSYNGDVDRVTTFTTSTPGVVGQNNTALDWTDGLGSNGTLDLGSSYHAPLPLDVIEGVQVGFDTGTALAGDSFAVTALTPRDTFTYTIESEPFTPPVIVLSYSDPQGSHRFVTSVELNSLGDDLSNYQGQMIPDIGLSPVTTEAFKPVNNTTYFVINSPHPTPIEGAHLYLNFVSDGELVAELPYTMTIPTGPTVIPVSWSTSVFSDTYNPDGDNILIAFWTDAQDNIIDSAARPLPTFQEDALAAVETATTTWNFGTVPQGTLLQKEISLANVGYVPLHVSTAGDTALTAELAAIGPAQFQNLNLALDTALLPIGNYNQTLTIHTSDINNPTLNINVSGTIAPLATEALAHGVSNIRPWDQYAYVPGPHSLNDVVTFDHTITDNPDQTHPLYVYTNDETTLLGVGEYGPDFNDLGVSSAIFGNGSDGDFSGGDPNTIRTSLSGNTSPGETVIPVANSSGFIVGKEILIIQMQGTNVGNHEFAIISEINSGHITVQNNLSNSYYQNSTSKAQVLFVPHFANVSGAITTSEWNETTGGIVVFRALSVNGASINVSTKGFKGGYGNGTPSNPCGSPGGQQGHSSVAVGGCSRSPNGGGGGAGFSVFGSGGGGGYGSAGGNGGGNGWGTGGLEYGSPELPHIYLGSGGGAGNWGTNPYGGGRSSIQGNDFSGQGSGAIYIAARNITGLSTIANGNVGGNSNGQFGGYAGGGGAGGSIKIIGGVISLSSGQASGGAGGDGTISDGGNGGNGRIRIEYCNSLTGTTNPPASTQQLNCYIIRQLPGNPNTELTLPEVISDTDYVRYLVPYGQRGNFVAAGTYTYTLTLPKRAYSTFTLDALFENLGTPTFNFTLDIGANGSVDWNGSGSQQPVIQNSANLASALNTYMSNTPGNWGADVSIPIRVTLNTSGDLFLTNLLAIPGGDSDPQISAADLTISHNNPAAGTSVTIEATVHNEGNYVADNIIASFFAGDPAEDGVYLGSKYIPVLAVDGDTAVSTVWDTTGYAGALDVYIVLDLAEQIPEMNENNNQAFATVNVVSNPTLYLPFVAKP